jgi:hypothetical protein
MLDPLSDWKARLLAMPSVNSAPSGAQNLADFIGDMSNKVQGGPTGTQGIFTFDRGTFVSTLLGSGFGPVADTSWVMKISNAWFAGSSGSTISPSTVTDGLWTVSTVDVNTIPTGAVTITTLSSAKSTLEAGLLSAGAPYVAGTITDPSQSDAQVEKFAQAFRDAILAFKFNCIGIGLVGPNPTNLSKIFDAL